MSSEESKIVFKHQENLVKTFFSITDESIFQQMKVLDLVGNPFQL